MGTCNHQNGRCVCTKSTGHAGPHYDRNRAAHWDNALDMETHMKPGVNPFLRCNVAAPTPWAFESGYRRCILPPQHAGILHVAGPADDTTVWQIRANGGFNTMRDACGSRFKSAVHEHICTEPRGHQQHAMQQPCQCVLCPATWNEQPLSSPVVEAPDTPERQAPARCGVIYSVIDDGHMHQCDARHQHAGNHVCRSPVHDISPFQWQQESLKKRFKGKSPAAPAAPAGSAGSAPSTSSLPNDAGPHQPHDHPHDRQRTINAALQQHHPVLGKSKMNRPQCACGMHFRDVDQLLEHMAYRVNDELILMTQQARKAATDAP